MTTYRMVVIGGKARMSRPSNVLYPLPKVCAATKVNRYVNVRPVPPTEIRATFPVSREWIPGKVISMNRYALVFP